MFSFRRWLDRKLDRRPMVRISRRSFRKPWWRRCGRAFLLLTFLLVLGAAILLLLQPVSAMQTSAPPPGAPSTDRPDSA
ncbi:hypothetical protein PX699_15485 [Sphingobium sp. H39-3-25]|nr:hypothetical protein [Sphingobium arseniciresistens]